MNVTHVVENLNRGGLERMVLDLVQEQQLRGDRCQVLCLFEAGTLAHELDGSGIGVMALGKRQGLDLRALSALRNAVRAHATEVLHTHNAVAHYLAVLATRGLPLRRTINTRHGMGALARVTRREQLYRLALHRTDAVATVCEAARQDAIRRRIIPVAKACVVPNGIRLEVHAPRSSPQCIQLRRMLRLTDGARVVGSVGRLNPLKDQTALIRAFAPVRARHRDCVLLLIGDGPLRAQLQDCAQAQGLADAVHFLGDRSDVPALLQGLDVFALPSRSEGYSMALLEACAAALPIVATDVGGNREIVRDGQTGLLVPAQDAAALTAALDRLLDDAALATRLGQAARAWVEHEGTLQAMAARYAGLYAATGTAT